MGVWKLKEDNYINGSPIMKLTFNIINNEAIHHQEYLDSGKIRKNL